jgi:membrane protein insertase Oxa1/YidC/SpoIIIJ
MIAALYTIIIYPVEQIIGLCFLFIYRIFSDPGIALCGVSAAVSVLTLPLYFAAEKWQIIERETVMRLSQKIARIKKAFSGDEQYLILAAYYRQNHYHPFYSLRSAFGLLVQVPFFIAAYLFISKLAVLQGTPFLFIRDLGVPDGLLPLGTRGANINVLPVLMTLINCAAGAVYTKGFSVREKIQIYGTALVFLVLLYNTPSALVLYWTLNNIFSLIKNILQKTPGAKRIVFVVLCGFTVFLNGYLLFFHTGALSKRLTVCFVTIAACLLYAANGFFIRCFDDIYADLYHKQAGRCRLTVFLLVLFNLLLLSGAVIPLSLIASSPQEFSFIEPYRSPFPIVLDAFLQAAGIFVFLPVCLYALLSRRVKTLLTLLLATLLSVALVNVFFMQGNYGNISNVLTFENPALIIPPEKLKIISVMAFFATLLGTLLLFTKLSPNIFIQCYGVLAFSLGTFSLYNAYGIQKTFAGYTEQEIRSATRSSYDGVYTFSETGKNVLVIMLDRAISGYTPFLFAEKPGLYDTFSGFTWYPNTVSLGPNTLLGVPPLYGGYEYAPEEMQRRDSEPLVEKHNEALIMLPRLFAENEWAARVMDPPWANYSWIPDISIYAPYPAVNARNIIGDRTTALWRARGINEEYQHLPLINAADELHKKLFRFSLFKFAPAFMRFFIYDNGDWLLPILDDGEQISRTLINEYAALDMLPEITAVTKEKKNTFTSMSSGLTHTPELLRLPDYTLATDVSRKEEGGGPFRDDKNYHVSMASFLLLGEWFQFLKDNNVYDNMRIIIVSDHGADEKNDLPGNITLPGGESLNSYNALLMVKDFNAKGNLKTDDTFMTNADVPGLSVEGLIENPANPFTGRPLITAKQNGVFVVTTAASWRPKAHLKNTFRIRKNDWLFVKDNIFKTDNWRSVER